MKKQVKTAAAIALALSAVTPVAAFAADASVAAGVYTSTSFTSLTDFNAKTAKQKAQALMDPTAVVVLGNGITVKADLILSASNEALNAATYATPAAYATANNVEFSTSGVKAPTASSELKVESVSAINGTQVQVKFTQPVTAADVVSGTSLTAHVALAGVGTAATDFAATGAITAALSSDGKTLTITTANPIWGNYKVTFADDQITLKSDVSKKLTGLVKTIAVSKDTTGPVASQEVKYVADGATKVDAVVSFSEPIASAGKVYVDGTELTTTSTDPIYYVFNANTDTITIKGLAPNKAYELAVVGSKDAAGNHLNPNYTVIALNTPADTVKPTAEVTVKDATITVVFSETLNATAPTFKVDGSAVAVGTTVGTNFVKDATNPNKYTYKADTLVTAANNGFKNVSVEVSAFTDLAGNAGSTVTKPVTLSVDAQAPKFVSSYAKGDKIYVKFDEAVNEASLSTVGLELTTAANVVLNNAAAAVTVTDHSDSGFDVDGNTAVLTDDEKQYLILQVTEAGFLENAKLRSGKYKVTLASGTVVDITTGPNATTTATTFTVDASNVAEPTVTGVTYNNGIITVVYDSKMGPSALVGSNYKIAGVAITGATLTFADIGQTTVDIKLPENYITLSGERKVTSSATSFDGVAVDTTANFADVTLTENVLPTVKSVAVVDGKNLTVNFTEEVSSSSALVDGTDIIVKVNGQVVTLASNPTVSTATSMSIVATSTTAFKNTDTITVEFKNGKIADANSNVLKDVIVTK